MLISGNGNGKNNTISRDEQLAILRQSMEENPLLQGTDDPSLESIRGLFPGYDITRLIGRGGQGAVYEAWRDGEIGMLAIKVLRDGPISSRRQEKRFRREIRLLQRLNHPGIVKVHDSGTINGKPYLVMPFVFGCPINEHATADALNLPERVELFLQTCAAVSAAHAKGIVHRDLKPANILVQSVFDDDDKEELFVRLLDFGLAKDLSEVPGDYTPSSDVSLSGQAVGTARYSSPEQICGQSVGVQSDIYSLGVVLFELLSDELPYVPTPTMRGYIDLITKGDRRSLREALRHHKRSTDYPFYPYQPKDVRRDLETVLDTAMAIEPAFRYESVDEFADDLRRYLAGKPVKAHIGVGQRIRSRARAYRRKFAVAAVIALVATLSTIAVVARNSANEAVRKSKEMALVSLSGLQIGYFVKQATAKYDAREPDQAISMLKKAVDLADLVPTYDPLICRQAYQAYYNLADYYFEANRPEEAIPYCEKATALSNALQESDPNDLLFMRLGSYSHLLSGRVYYERKTWQKALPNFQTTLTVRKALAEREPSVVHRKLEVADAHTWVGKTLRKLKRLDGAVRHDSAACRIFTDLLSSEPGMAEYAIRLTHAEGQLGLNYMSYKTGDTDVLALEVFARARQRVTEELNTTPGQRDLIADLLAAIDTNMATLNRRSPSD